MNLQDALAGATVLGAVVFLVKKLILVPAAKGKGPDVTTKSLVKRARDKKRHHSDHGCHS